MCCVTVLQIMSADLVPYFRVFLVSVISNKTEGQVLGFIPYMPQIFLLAQQPPVG